MWDLVGNPEDWFSHNEAHIGSQVSMGNVSFVKCHGCRHQMSRMTRKPAFCLCENKDADQLHGYSFNSLNEAVLLVPIIYVLSKNKKKKSDNCHLYSH